MHSMKVGGWNKGEKFLEDIMNYRYSFYLPSLKMENTGV